MSETGVVSIPAGRASLVTGLTWHTLPLRRQDDAKPSALRAVAGQHAKEFKKSCGVLLTGWYIQVGLADSLTADKKPAYSLAAAVLQGPEKASLPANWLGAFALPDGSVWVAAVREGALLPDGDWAGSEADALTRFNTYLAQEGWETLYAPASWGIPNAVERAYHTLLETDRRDIPQPVRAARVVDLTGKAARRSKVLLAVLGLAVALGLIGLRLYHEHQAEIAAKLEAARQAAEAQALAEKAAELARAKQPPPPKPLPHPWPTMPEVATFFKVCADAQQRMPLNVAGWQLAELNCTPQELQAVYARGTSGAPQAVLLRKLRGAAPAKTADQAVASFTLAMPESGREEALPPIAQARDWALAVTQYTNWKVTAQERPPVVPQPATPEGQRYYADWTELHLALDSKFNPQSFSGLLAIPGLRPMRLNLRFDPAGGVTYLFEGRIHAAP